MRHSVAGILGIAAALVVSAVSPLGTVAVAAELAPRTAILQPGVVASIKRRYEAMHSRPDQARHCLERALAANRKCVRASLMLGDLDAACRGKGNVMGPILSAVRVYATLGEISDVMRSVFGNHQGKVTV